MPESTRKRNSFAPVVVRCLMLLLRLLHGPAHTDELRQIIVNSLHTYEDAAATVEDTSRDKRFEYDRERLRKWFGCHIKFNRKTREYTLIAIDQPIFDLPDRALRGLAFLQATFSGENVPMSAEVIALFDAILIMLPADRRESLRKERGLLELNLKQRDQDQIPDAVMQAVQQACMEKRQLSFTYWAASRPEKEARLHVVEPRRYYFENGHFYLEAYCLTIDGGPKGKMTKNEMQRYRMGRISESHVLPKLFVPTNNFRRYELIYQLQPDVARGGVTEHFPNSKIDYQTDGSAIVRTTSATLFFDLRTLLHYGAGCRVIGGEEAVKQMTALVAAMYKNYHDF